ncbi:hypothetical protein [Mesorhizobium sp. M0203]|uniref:hypothetical protein n=1 Tax=unclassified Mesorhizobium TaxID=325217 RepID=UPI00333C9906
MINYNALKDFPFRRSSAILLRYSSRHGAPGCTSCLLLRILDRGSDIQIGDRQRVLLDEFAPWLDLVAHQREDRLSASVTSLTLTCKNERTKRSAISPMFMVRLHFLAVLFLTTVRTVDRHRARNQVFQSGPSSTM